MFVILRSEATKNPKPSREYYVHILISETHSLNMESENPMWVELSAGWSEALGFFTASVAEGSE